MLILICIPIFIEIEMLRDSKIHLSKFINTELNPQQVFERDSYVS